MVEHSVPHTVTATPERVMERDLALHESSRVGLVVCRFDDLDDVTSLRPLAANAAAETATGEPLRERIGTRNLQ